MLERLEEEKDKKANAWMKVVQRERAAVLQAQRQATRITLAKHMLKKEGVEVPFKAKMHLIIGEALIQTQRAISAARFYRMRAMRLYFQWSKLD